LTKISKVSPSKILTALPRNVDWASELKSNVQTITNNNNKNLDFKKS
jgi:hypothetical protein